MVNNIIVGMIQINIFSNLNRVTMGHRVLGRKILKSIREKFSPITLSMEICLGLDRRTIIIKNNHAIGMFLDVTKNSLGCSKIILPWYKIILGENFERIYRIKRPRVTQKMILEIVELYLECSSGQHNS